ncbi:MAG: 2-dehydro-3-deoxyphosphooctonate aldolase [Pirellulaceae bacterium]|nr:MAG: 2-dehydro-3-deoxyphosphooctonate aldolase [Pirellulaceae bacterium]
MVQPVPIGTVTVGAPQQPLVLIAGPCVIENRDLTLRIASDLQRISQRLAVPIIFKASFDKANRTSGQSFRGLGMDAGLRILEEVRQQTGLPTTTDIHLPDQARPVAQVCQLLQIPAFLARQTDLLLAAAETGKPVNVKKGQFMAPAEMRHVVEKIRSVDHHGGVLLCERGTFFGYGRLVNDMTGLVEMRRMGVPVIFDATHSVQRPGGLGDQTGGNRQMVAPLARAAVAVGIDGVFLETHPDPDRSPSDGANMVPLENVESLVVQLLRIAELAAQWLD